MEVVENGEYFVLKVPAGAKTKKTVADLMAYRGLQFSISRSSKDEAVLFSSDPYSVCDLATPDSPKLGAYRRSIDLSRAENGKGTVRLPAGKELWNYQKATLDYLLARGGGINGDQPGLGKTPTSIAYCNEREAQRVLVIVPASLRLQWADRIKEWSVIPRLKVSTMLKTKDGIHPTAHYQVISYEAARNPAIVKAILKYKWDVLICDEAHKLKNIEAVMTRAIVGNSKREFVYRKEKLPAIMTACKEFLALTGTLLLNRPSECYVLFRAFDWEAIDFMSEQDFKDRYNRQAEMTTVSGKRFKLESTSLETELQNRLRANIMTRHEKLDVLKDMKPPRYSVVRCEENGDVKAALDAENLLDFDVEQVETKKDIETLGHIAEARRLMGVALAPQIAEYAREFLENTEEKLTIFCWHHEVLDVFQEELKRFGVVRVDGRMSTKKKQENVNVFCENPETRVIIGNIQSMGTGTDGLQHVCWKCYIAEPDWVPAQNEQAVSRLDRFGQENIVSAEIFVAPGSITEKIFVRALKKLNTIHKVLDERG
jgi:SNF2 family DNA or RNA helicase